MMFPCHPGFCFYFLLFCLRSSLGENQDFSEPQVPHVQQYEVVEPLQLPILGILRELSSDTAVYPETVRYHLGLRDSNFTLHLFRNRYLVGSDYTETYTLANGTEVTEQPKEEKHCFYQGHVEGHQDSSASISICDGIRGFFQIGPIIHLIEPLVQGRYGSIQERSGNAQGKHVVYRENYFKKKWSLCGISRASLQGELETKMATINMPRSWVPGSIPKETHYVELYVVVEYTEFKKYGNLWNIRTRVKEVVNQIDRLYQLLNFRVVLIGLEIWDKGNKAAITNDIQSSLNSFLKWRENNLIKKKKHDNAQLITALDFGEDVVGLARLGSMCTLGSGGVNQDHESHPFGLATSIAHEMGHNLGMDHDENVKGCRCEVSKMQGGCVMQSMGVSNAYPKQFSSCSKDNLQKFLSGAIFQANCLTNFPDLEQIEGGPVCGNKFVERGEECDCGPPEECVNQCCNPVNCRRAPGADCVEGECCQACHLTAAGELCRGAQDVCDLAEYCNGRQAKCPENVYKENGTPCWEGYCYNGACPTYKQQCEALWGTGSRVSDDRCFWLGLSRGCTLADYPAKGGFNKCGDLHCSRANTSTPSRALCTFILGGERCDLAVTEIESHNPFEIVATGTKCGEQMVCYHKRCQGLGIYGSEDCSSQCHNHGVCNHKRECHCEPGWAPPYCQSQLSHFNSEI
ncbi:disintegrin and metalloproteinase domain-containing protein 8-like [Trichosurus vulpecula]|uniref:disintegrin and metalloproteinase domain-containing protein 8-like n=1 Tax=Trichosurus vulpecula TaxID=9337 RepID=UPI00186AFD30|nr:disintegrin and metalloproteinase domain-containing protein 8-like [Trichosurus vulpecula]